MAGKKGGAVQLQAEVNDEEDWENLLKRKGLIVADIYSEWCGPCLAMVGNLKRLKLELGCDYLHLATVKSDYINALQRFRNQSEPTWMFIANGQLVRVTFGADAPKLLRIINQELDKELRALKGEARRTAVPFEEMTEEEQVRAKKLADKLEAERLKEEKEIAQQLEELKMKSLTKLARKLASHTFALYFPHMINEEKRTCSAALKMLHQYDTIALMVIDQHEVLIKEEELPEVFYRSTQKFPPKFVESISKRPCLVVLLLGLLGSGETDAEIDECLGEVEGKLGGLIYGPNKDPNKPGPNTPAANFAEDVEDELWPGIWAPLDYFTKASAVKILFPSLIRAIGYEDVAPPPPRLIMIFEATKAKEVNELAEEYASEVLKVGYFDSTDPETAKKVCRKITGLKRLMPDKLNATKVVMSIAKRTSDPLLAFAQLNPIYISPDVKTGTKEADAFFPPDEEEVEETEEDVEIEDFTIGVGEEREEGEEEGGEGQRGEEGEGGEGERGVGGGGDGDGERGEGEEGETGEGEEGERGEGEEGERGEGEEGGEEHLMEEVTAEGETTTETDLPEGTSDPTTPASTEPDVTEFSATDAGESSAEDTEASTVGDSETQPEEG